MGDTHFDSTQITLAEVEWLTAHNKMEKVLLVTAAAYAAASKWEPFPRISLSREDLAKVDSERVAHLRSIDEATKIASKLLVRRGTDAGPEQQVVAFNGKDIEWMQNRMKKGAKTNSKVAAAQVSKRVVVPTRQVHHQPDSECDVVECPELVVGGCLQSTCAKYSFCSLHIAHSSHSRQSAVRKAVPPLPEHGLIISSTKQVLYYFYINFFFY